MEVLSSACFRFESMPLATVPEAIFREKGEGCIEGVAEAKPGLKFVDVMKSFCKPEPFEFLVSEKASS